MLRKFPLQYSSEVKTILNAMSIGDPNIVGSSVDRRLLYSADYDMIQEIELSPASSHAFIKHIAELHSLPNTHITDIKIGEIPNWNLVTSNKYVRKDEIKHLELLLDEGIIDSHEYKEAKKLLPRHMTPLKLIEARKELRFGILRWTPKDVFKGYLKLRNGKTITLVDALRSLGITKIDVISFVNGKYTDFSNIILWKGYSEITGMTLKDSLIYYLGERNYWKALKRIFSIAKDMKDEKLQETCLEILNSKLGYISNIVSDMEVLQSLTQRDLTKKERRNINYELNTIIDRLSKVYIDGFKRAKRVSFKLLPKLDSILQHETKLAMEQEGLLPLPY